VKVEPPAVALYATHGCPPVVIVKGSSMKFWPEATGAENAMVVPLE
jgi:hypothetical protein